MNKIEWVLRIALFGEFLGHGYFAFQASEHFQELLIGVTGVSPAAAVRTLFVIALIDFAVAVLALVKPVRAVLLYAAIWGFLTALARPVSGVRGVWDFVERWPNCGVPLALLLVRGWPSNGKDWFK
jgi:hypothetical protein